MQLPLLSVQVVVGVPPPVLNLHQLCLEGRFSTGVSRQQEAPASLHCQDVASLLPLEHSLPQLDEKRQRQRADGEQINY